MAQKGVQLDRETFSCPICLELLKDPVTIQCGHSYCMQCINTHWDEENQKGFHTCPQCRKIFRQRPVLEKNTMLVTLMEELKKTELQATPADHHFAGPEDVACDFCTGRKRKAVKSCLVCPASYCENHLQPHYDVPPLKKHKLVEPSKNLEENICSRHDEVMKLFCRTDQQSICYLCSVEEHKGHDTVSAAAERTERQRELEVRQLKIQRRIQHRRRNVKLVRQDLKDVSVSADRTLEKSGKIVEGLTRLIHNSSNVMYAQIKTQQEIEKSQVEELQKKLEQEISDLKKKDAELKQLFDTPDPIKFLHNYPSVSALIESTNSSSINISPRRHFEEMLEVLKELREEIQIILRNTWDSISKIIDLPDLLVPEPQPREPYEFYRYSRELTLDPNTAFTSSVLSDEDRKITRVSQDQGYPDHPDRFTKWCQVLSRESLSGRCYWEVGWKGRGCMAVAYKSISRTGDDLGFRQSDKSWALECYGNTFRFWHNGINTLVPAPRSCVVGVYLDPIAGILSFYNISGHRALLHSVRTKFTEPLHAGFWTEESIGFVPRTHFFG